MRASVVTVLCLAPLGAGAPPGALDEASRAAGEAVRDRAIAWLITQQDVRTGGWSVAPGDAPQLPAVSGLVLTGLVMPGGLDIDDARVERAADYLLSFAKPDGGVHDGVLPSYNTSICLSALARLGSGEAKAAIPRAQAFLRGLQWGEASSDHPSTGNVPKSHPFYGGVGYGRSGRPDNSNLNMMLQGLHDSGVPGDDPAFQRALTFLQRTQMLDEVNDMPYADGSIQGGFIYSTSPNSERIGEGESKAGEIDEALIDGRSVSRLRAYGSMTYAGFKSYLYANLGPDDPRVAAAADWIAANYTLEENPGIGLDGFYYYLVTFARALDAAGIEEIETEQKLRCRPDVAPLRGRAAGDAGDIGACILETGERLELPAPAWVAAGTPERPRFDVRQSRGVLADGRRYELGDLDADGWTTLTLRERRRWRADLIERLAELQNDDGAFRSVDDRWMEDNEVLITAYALIALQHALRDGDEAP